MKWIVPEENGLFSGCVGEAVAQMFVDVPLDGGDLFLLGVFGGGGQHQVV